jgi:hypothetical protein
VRRRLYIAATVMLLLGVIVAAFPCPAFAYGPTMWAQGVDLHVSNISGAWVNVQYSDATTMAGAGSIVWTDVPGAWTSGVTSPPDWTFRMSPEHSLYRLLNGNGGVAVFPNPASSIWGPPAGSGTTTLTVTVTRTVDATETHVVTETVPLYTLSGSVPVGDGTVAADAESTAALLLGVGLLAFGVLALVGMKAGGL